VPGKGPALGPAAVTPSPASKSYPPVQGPVTSDATAVAGGGRRRKAAEVGGARGAPGRGQGVPGAL
ncbi:hypothetical protein EI555_014113, partial [Monodon monoceros]